jgi:hypothetical protein
MSKFNNSTASARAGSSYIETSGAVGYNHKGELAYGKVAKSELFLAVVSDFAGENTFYENASARSNRIAALVAEVAKEDPQWITDFTYWLRNEANMRSISLVLALESARAFIKAGTPGGRKIVANAISRADEPGEALAWWFANVGRKLPAAVKRGIADAATKTYNEYSLGKYDTDSHGFRFADVINLTHPTPVTPQQSDVFGYALARRRDSNAEIPASLKMVEKRKAILASSLEEKRALLTSANASAELKSAGLTWENIGSSFGKGGLDAQAWEAVIPTMGYMALIRNLRNFEEKGVSPEVLDKVAARIANKEEVLKSKQLPFRFLSAHRAVSGFTRDPWGHVRKTAQGSGRFEFPLEQALNYSLENVPVLKGNTLILVDRSGSMFYSMSEKTQMNYADTAALFGSALAVRAENAKLVEFGSNSAEVSFKKYSSILKTVNTFNSLGGTSTAKAVQTHFNKSFDRVIILTDEQSFGGDPGDQVPANVPVYTFNLVGYKNGHKGNKPNRVHIGGLQDQSFGIIPMLEAGQNAVWPWEK